MKKKSIDFELMRIIAIIFVIFNHTGGYGFLLFTKRPIGSIQFFVYMFVSVFCRFAVPLFFMISGALMLGKKETIKDIWKKRISKIFIVILAFTLLYYLVDIEMDFSKFSIGELLLHIYKCDLRIHLWFLYAYIGYLISLPFLRSLVKNLNQKDYYYMIVLAIVLSAIIPIFQCIVLNGKATITSHLNLSWIVYCTILYPCIGYFLQKNIDKKLTNKKLLLLWAVNIVCICISCFMIYYKIKSLGKIDFPSFHDFFSIFALVNAICIFTTVKVLCNKYRFSSLIQKIIMVMGSCTFGIYLIHPYVKDNILFMGRVLKVLLNTPLNKMIVIWVWILCIFLVSFAITWLLKKIPVIKKVL